MRLTVHKKAILPACVLDLDHAGCMQCFASGLDPDSGVLLK